jgi:hypothetical protein
MANDGNRSGIEAKANQFRHNVAAAKARYERARREFEELQAVAKNFGSGALYNPQAISRAAASLDAAMADYQTAVERFSDFVLNQAGAPNESGRSAS